MGRRAKRIELAEGDRPTLEAMARATSLEQRLVERARIVLLASEGVAPAAIAERVGCHLVTAKKWRRRYEEGGLGGLRDAPRPGGPLTHGPAARARLIAKACTRPPQTDSGQRRERWTYRELGEAVGMSDSQAHAILAAAAIKPHRTDYWIMSDFSREEFEERAGAVCGLYLDPPKNTIVVSIDEKTGVQAKCPTRPDTLPGPGRAARRGASTSTAATAPRTCSACLSVHTGEVMAMPTKTRNRFDLLAFLDKLEGEIPAGKQIVAITDNLSTRGTQEVSDWLADHPRWSFQFTPVHASWLNQVEIFFSILARRLLKNGAFTSEADLAEQMLAFVETYNQTAKPFAWTYTGKVLAA